MLDMKVQTFLTVCETMNYTRAAELLHLTQPAVSKQIQALEDYYQVTLFRYQNRVLTLTSDGEYLRHVLRAMNQDLQKVQSEVHRTRDRIRIRVGATLSIGNYSLVQRIPDFLRSHPGIDISLTIADTKILLDHLDHNRLDFILCEGNFTKSKYEYRLLREVPMAIFCGVDYEIGEIHRVSDLLSHTLLLREKGSGTREIFENYLKSVGYSIQDFPNYHEINHSEVILKLLAANMGISVLYEDIGAEMVAAGQLRKLSMEPYRLVHEFNLIWNKSSIQNDLFHPAMEDLYLTMTTR